jgi:hypothetical protein
MKVILSVPDEGYFERTFKITFIRYAQNPKIGKQKSLKVFGNNTIKGPKQDSQNWLRSPVPERGEP